MFREEVGKDIPVTKMFNFTAPVPFAQVPVTLYSKELVLFGKEEKGDYHLATILV